MSTQDVIFASGVPSRARHPLPIPTACTQGEGGAAGAIEGVAWMGVNGCRGGGGVYAGASHAIDLD